MSTVAAARPRGPRCVRPQRAVLASTAPRRAALAAAALGCGLLACDAGPTDAPLEPAPQQAVTEAAPRVATAPGGSAADMPIDGVARVAPAQMGSGLRVVLLGTGTPVPNPRRSGPAVAVIADGRAYLVDFGPGVVRRAVQASERGVAALDPTRLSFALATHLHSDHTAGLSDLWLTPAAVGRERALSLLGPAGTAAMAAHVERAYATDLAIRGHGRQAQQMAGYALRARDVEAGRVHVEGALRIDAFDVSHGRFEAAFGYRFDDGERRIVISGDTAPSDAVVAACDGCDVLVHEVYCKAGFDRGPPEFQGYHAAFHTSAPQLAAFATRARPGLLVLNHLLLFGCSEQQLLDEVRAHYAGKVALGGDLDIF